MKAATTRKTKAAKRTDRGVPFQEMRRLMHVYGSIKCLRKRQNPGGEENTKIDSVKRKFYRWFPDLDERFVKDDEGFYRPKSGHEFEMRYREEMRMKDGEILAKKRARCRKERHGSAVVKTKRIKIKATSTPSTFTNCARVCPVVSPMVSPVIFPDLALSVPSFPNLGSSGVNTDITLNYDHIPMVSSSAAITADTEPVDSYFIAEQGIFDDVENSFYGPTVQECSSIQCSSCSSSSEDPDHASSSWDSDSPSIEGMLERSIEECCEEILGSDDNDSMSGYLFDIISQDLELK
mmetsp:Transcript_23720/g.51313  ORF Transcript_23720/g.51313 Transcript_23720/m.51313 type:complete len:293 (+) Transcript_23720:156-1034(+)|eukprot:CAMPEP_0172308186 /NCGR_PEP_ID=MMETSP1058-20130122/8864_1 /TAXON_ID=83371 /ORGANISM="Detonula confervacea, Strain CCMP 353" /LENGTH=292 /DNA_ID=CAMNT_0013020549 /DNA_START=121 /DNA_END=999 /DNA_ORIENTATION=+